MNNFKKLAFSLFAVVSILGLPFLFADINEEIDIIPTTFAADIITSGSCGSNVTYTLDSDGTLIISGTGNMKEYYLTSQIWFPWNSYSGDIRRVVISDGVTSVGMYAFYDCSNLQSVTVPASVSAIGAGAFSSCVSLAEIYVDKENEYYSSDENGVLFNKTKTLLVQYPVGKAETEYLIPEGVTAIGSRAFQDSKNIQRIIVSDSVKSIGSHAFYNCTSLQDAVLGNGVTTLEGSVFSCCTALQDITIPDSVTSIGDNAFYSCKGLQSITIPDSVISIGKYIFENCTELQIASIGNGVSKIAENSFDNCSSLRLVTIGRHVTSIEEQAFWNCRKLKCIIFNGSKEQWQNISIDATTHIFISLAKIYCLENEYVTDGKNILNKQKTLLVYQYATDKVCSVPNGIKSIEQSAFFDNSSLSAIILPEGLNYIGSSAFGLGLSNIYIPASVTNIAEYAFDACSKLSDVYFGGTEEQFKAISIGRNNTYLTDATIHYNTKLTEVDGVIYTEDMKTLVSCSDKKSGTFVIPETVTAISSYAFAECKKITQISIPEAVTAIGNGAFCNCDGITEIRLPDGITKINQSAFNDCDNLHSITIPTSVTSIGDCAFCSCDNLKVISFNTELLTIGNSAFDSCIAIEKLLLPDSLTSIGNGTFSNCIMLSEIYFPSSLTAIGNYAFYKNSALTVISLPDSVNSLGVYSFSYCENLEKVCLPEGTLSSIPANAFNGCQKLKSIFIPENIASFGDSAFYGCNNLSDIYYGATEAEWDKISIFSSNSVIWAANIHFEHSHINNNWKTIIDAEAHKAGLKSSICDVCSYETRESIPIIHTEISMEAVAPTCSAIGYAAGIYCKDCQKYVSGHTEVAINPSNHVNTKTVPETPATFESVGYTVGEYCNDCQKYILGHVEIPKLIPAFTDSSDAKVNGSDVISNNGLTVAQLLSQAGSGAVIKKADGSAVENATLIGTGMILTLADGSKKEIVVYGDADGDGKVSSSDARLALRASVGLDSFAESSCYYKAANVECKDKLSSADARLILRASVGLEDTKTWMK